MQYFDNNPDLKNSPRIISFEIMDRHFALKSDAGVFSNHEVDKGSIALLNVLLKEKMHGHILDLGCGYGTIGIVLASFFPEIEILATDVNTRACELCAENAQSLNLNQITVRDSDCFEKIKEEFDYVVINPPIRAGKKVIFNMYEGAYQHLKINGSLWIVIRKNLGAESSQKYLSELFNNCYLRKKDKGYYIYEAIKQGQKTQEGDLQ